MRISEELMGQIEARYLLLHGADPGQVYLDWLTAHLSIATIEIWAEAGHFLHLVEPERFVQRVVGFLAS